MRIIVMKNNWCNSKISEYYKVLKNTSSHIERNLRDPIIGIIHVQHWFKKPRVLFRDSTDDPYIIRLNARDSRWDQQAFQFAHEFCHVLSNYQILRDNPNNWFHEAICEVASIFALNRMAEQWHKRSPILNKRFYATYLGSYAKNRLAKKEAHLPEGMTLHTWLSGHEESMRREPVEDESQRVKQCLVAYQMLPIFEETPSGWNAVRLLPNSRGCLEEYFVDWHAAVDSQDKLFVKRLANLFEFTIPD